MIVRHDGHPSDIQEMRSEGRYQSLPYQHLSPSTSRQVNKSPSPINTHAAASSTQSKLSQRPALARTIEIGRSDPGVRPAGTDPSIGAQRWRIPLMTNSTMPDDTLIDASTLKGNVVIKTVPDTEDDLDLDDCSSDLTDENSLSDISGLAISTRTPGSSAKVPESAKANRRRRGMSFLPVRQSNEPLRSLGSPPKTPSPSKSTHISPPRFDMDSADCRNNHRSPLGPTRGRVANSVPGHEFSDTSAKSGKAAIVSNDQLLDTYITQLAAKEARVSNLRVTIADLSRELKDAESDLVKFKNNGKQLAELVHSGTDAFKAKQAGFKAASGEQNDVLGIGKRVVGEIGTQFWSFVEDVKSATMGNDEFAHQMSSQTEHAVAESPSSPSGRSGTRSAPVLPMRPRDRTPSPQRRQLSPKRSIQNFLKNRSPSPVRNSLTGSTSPHRQELAGYHASQRLRESDRLTKKLSQIDLRAPLSPRDLVD